jgi:hypothetical protein
MKIILFLASMLFLTNAYSQKEFAKIQLTTGSSISAFDGGNTEESLLKMRKMGRSTTNSNLGFITLDGDFLLYFDEKGEVIKQHIKDISKVTIDSKSFNNLQVTAKATAYQKDFIRVKVDTDEIILMPLPIRRNMNRMQQLIAENDSYILTNLFSNGINYFYIYDKQHTIVENQISHSLTKGKSEKAIQVVEKYFPDCEKLLTGLKSNVLNTYGRGMQTQYFLLMTIDGDNNATNYLTGIKCNE